MGGETRTTGSTSSKFHKHRAVKLSRLPRSRHDKCQASDYADEQLANLQKRIYVIEFLRLDLIIVYQGAPTPTKKCRPSMVGFFFVQI